MEEHAEFYEKLFDKPTGSFRGLYQSVPFFEVDSIQDSAHEREWL
jgi:hypothetical protein